MSISTERAIELLGEAASGSFTTGSDLREACRMGCTALNERKIAKTLHESTIACVNCGTRLIILKDVDANTCPNCGMKYTVVWP